MRGLAGVVVLSTEPGRVVCYMGGESAVLTFRDGFWRGYGITPVETLAPDWHDPTTRLLVIDHTARRLGGKAGFIHDGHLFTAPTLQRFRLVGGEEAGVAALLAGTYLSRERPRRIGRVDGR